MSTNEPTRAHPGIRWPVGLSPREGQVFAHNELTVDVPAAAIFRHLVRATAWPSFYGNARRIRLAGGGDELAPGVRFTWWTFGVPVTTVVDAFEVDRYLAWSGSGLGSRGHHAWLLEPTPGGCRIVTEEVQRGASVALLAPLLRVGLRQQHQRWLEGLAAAARLGGVGRP